MMLMRRFCVCVFSDLLYKSICCRYSFELHRQVDAIQMGTHNVCLYKEVNRKYAGCNLKTMELLDCALIGVCAVIRSNTVLIISALQTMGDRYNCRSTLIGVCFVFFFFFFFYFVMFGRLLF